MKTNFNKNTLFVFRLVFKIDKWFYLLAALKILFDFVKPFIMIVFPKLILDSVSSSAPMKQTIIYIFVLVMVSLFVDLILNRINSIMRCRKIKIDEKFQLHLANKIMNMDYPNLEDPNILNKFQHSINSLSNVSISDIIDSIISLCTNISIFVGTLYIIKFLGFIIVPVFIVVMIVNTISQKRRTNARYKFEKENVGLLREARYNEQVMTDNSYAKEIRLYNMKNFISNTYMKKLSDYNSLWWDSIGMRIFYYFICFFVEAIRDFIIYAYIAYKYLTGVITIGGFSMYIAAAFNFSKTINAIFITIASFDVKIKNIQDIRFFYEMNSNYDINTKIKCLDYFQKEFQFEFKNVSFKYTGQHDYALKNINIKIKSGEKLSIVGPNGAGKTTFIKLFMRLYEPTEGEILFNGININKLDFNEYLQSFSAIFQDYIVFPFKLKENVSFDKDVDIDKMNRIFRMLGLDKVIEKLENREDTYISKKFDETGVELSGGEQQKLIIARTLYKNAEINIFDEPTSALSPIAEYEILKNFNNLVKNRTTIYISHRMACCKFSDKIAVFKDGEIIQYGSHEILIQQDNAYKEMFNTQAQNFIKK